MTEEFNLSEKEQDDCYHLNCYSQRDVKEFIRLLKEEMEKHTKIVHDDNFNEWREIDLAYGQFVELLNEIAGDKLI